MVFENRPMRIVGLRTGRPRRHRPERAEEALALGLKGLSVDLEDRIRDETNHKEENQRILRDGSLWFSAIVPRKFVLGDYKAQRMPCFFTNR